MMGKEKEKKSILLKVFSTIRSCDGREKDGGASQGEEGGGATQGNDLGIGYAISKIRSVNGEQEGIGKVSMTYSPNDSNPPI